MHSTHQVKGFTLIELVAVLVLVALLGAAVTPKLFSQSAFNLQASRDQLLAAYYSAQQLAMVRSAPVRFSTSSNQLDIRQDTNGNSSFADEASLRIDGVQYPVALPSSQTLTAVNFDFNRLGRTDAAQLTLAHGGHSVTVVVSAAGNIQ